MPGSNRYREVRVQGRPREMGRQIGEAAGEEVRHFCAIALDRVNRTTRVSRGTADRIVATALPMAEQYAPDMVEELRGIAEAAKVTLADIMLLQVRNQLQPDAEGCTSLSLRGTALGAGPLLAQNWDSDPALDACTIVLARYPEGKPAFLTVTQAGLIAYIGCSEAGIGICLNTLPAPMRTTGVPHYFTVRGIYESTSLDQAVAAVRRAERAIPANIMLATPQGPADLEVTLDDVHVLQPLPPDASPPVHGIAHTNHCLHRELAAWNDQFPELIQSHDRQRRIHELLPLCGAEAPALEHVQSALRDHANYPRSICRHTNDDPLTGFWETVFSVVMQPEQRQMWVSRGTPCNHGYELYELR
ncbi:MAG: C45 family autoproteolytic acyltransferase/hydrolase [Pirellulaceae bacterium]